MSKTSNLFKITTIFCLAVDVIFAILCTITLLNVLLKYMVLEKIHFILFIVVMAINVLYVIYLLSVLIYNRIKH